MAGVAVAAAIGGAAVIGGVTSYLGAQAQADAASQAAQAQANASSNAQALQYQMFQEQKQLQQPWYDVGVRTLPKLEAQANKMPGAFKAPAQYALPEAFTGKVDLTQDPGYAFRLKEGLKALDRTASARGGMLSGGALKSAAEYGQEMGSQEYQNAYARAMNEYNAKVARANSGYGRSLDEYNAAVTREATGYNRLANLAGVGQTTAGNLASQAGQYGTNVGNLIMQTGESQANSLLAQGNARASQYGAIGNAIGGMAGAYGGYAQGQQNQANINRYLNILGG